MRQITLATFLIVMFSVAASALSDESEIAQIDAKANTFTVKNVARVIWRMVNYCFESWAVTIRLWI